MAHGVYIVIDFGKTLSKISLWSRGGHMLDRQVRPNQPVVVDGVRRLDVMGIGDWLIETLARYSGHPIEAIVPVGHGAAVVAIADGALDCMPVDYELDIPTDMMNAYRAGRDEFAITGSPALPSGLNLGAQLHYLGELDRNPSDSAILLPWAQYWAWFLSGEAVSEASSLGCHTDLWAPLLDDFSPMAKRRGWAGRFAPMKHAGDVAGSLLPSITARTGLPASTRVLVGLHDSNAALLAARGFPEIAAHESTILSTGTWLVAMRLPRDGFEIGMVPEARDCLINVDVERRPVPSARFMGGKEIESIIGIDTRRVDITPDQPALLAAVEQAVNAGAMLLPTFAKGFGPFAQSIGRWENEPTDWDARRAAACLYAAHVANVSLGLIGTSGRVLVEGRFAGAKVFVRALARIRPDLEIYTANAHNDVSFGALRLIDPDLQPQGDLLAVEPLSEDLAGYSRLWSARACDAGAEYLR